MNGIAQHGGPKSAGSNSRRNGLACSVFVVTAFLLAPQRAAAGNNQKFEDRSDAVAIINEFVVDSSDPNAFEFFNILDLCPNGNIIAVHTESSGGTGSDTQVLHRINTTTKTEQELARTGDTFEDGGGATVTVEGFTDARCHGLAGEIVVVARGEIASVSKSFNVTTGAEGLLLVDPGLEPAVDIIDPLFLVEDAQVSHMAFRARQISDQNRAVCTSTYRSDTDEWDSFTCPVVEGSPLSPGGPLVQSIPFSTNFAVNTQGSIIGEIDLEPSDPMFSSDSAIFVIAPGFLPADAVLRRGDPINTNDGTNPSVSRIVGCCGFDGTGRIGATARLEVDGVNATSSTDEIALFFDPTSLPDLADFAREGSGFDRGLTMPLLSNPVVFTHGFIAEKKLVFRDIGAAIEDEIARVGDLLPTGEEIVEIPIATSINRNGTVLWRARVRDPQTVGPTTDVHFVYDPARGMSHERMRVGNVIEGLGTVTGLSAGQHVFPSAGGGDGRRRVLDDQDRSVHAVVVDSGIGGSSLALVRTLVCEAGTSACGESCVDTQTDPEHCGACDNACRPGGACAAGVCTGVCGDPVDPTPPPPGAAAGTRVLTATDALFVLLAGVGAGQCLDCVCDVNGSGTITATDALIVLQAAVGQQVVLACPPCG